MTTADSFSLPPIEGGRAGDGGADFPQGAAPSSHLHAAATEIQQSPPSLTLPPSRGKGNGRPAVGGVKRARRLRKTQTFVESKLWDALRATKMNFRRQVPIGPYVADFAHHGAKLIVEVDGYQHTTPEGVERDAVRDAWFKAEGFRVLRFSDARAGDDTYAVVDEIVAAAETPPSPTVGFASRRGPPSRGKGA